jgi:DNA-binding transcriptional ArsR family regulator
MTAAPSIAEIAALVGDPARANMLLALMDGRALTASELAYAARVAPPTASGHLGKLVGARLLALEKQGRHRYFRLASPAVADLLEGLMAIAVDGAPRYRPPSRGDEALRSARTCYDHLAGRLGVALTDRLLSRGHIVLDDDAGQVTADGGRFFDEFGLDLACAESRRRRFCRPCLDWSERRRHLGGVVGAAVATRCFELGWIEHVKGSRAITITAAGRSGFLAIFAIAIDT